MPIAEVLVLRWLHILAMVYWLGGEWGVFQTSRHVVNPGLSMEERRRHMETAYRIDILARTGIILLLPLGLHMGNMYGIQPFGGSWLWGMWAVSGGWLALCWAAFAHRETDLGVRLTLWDERIRYVVIPVLLVSAVLSLLGHGPFRAGPGLMWFSYKVLIYSLLLVIGLYLRFVMREWTKLFRVLAEGPDAEAERKLAKSLRFGKRLAYVYWVGIAATAFLGTTKFV